MNSHAELELSIARALASHDLALAATQIIDGFGPEILGYLVGRLRSEHDADEVFSRFAEDLWRSLPELTLRTSMRAYAYALARNATHRYLARDVRSDRRHVPLSSAPGFDELVAKVRTITPAYLRTETKTAIARLRETLSEQEQALLTLRIDRGLEWLEIAEVLCEPDDLDLARGSARLRKQFESVKKKLARLAREEGLL